MSYAHLEGRKYQRRFENRSMRPYFTVMILDVYQRAFKEFLGFSYERSVHVVSDVMGNQAYIEEEEMAAAAKHFAKIWPKELKDKKIRTDLRSTFAKLEALGREAWQNDYARMPNVELTAAVGTYRDATVLAMSRFILSQPWQVVPLEQELNELLEPLDNRDEVLKAATHYPHDLPWTQEDKEIGALHGQWSKLSAAEQEEALGKLAAQYGWLNDVEGDKSFSVEHYRQKIEEYTEEQPLDVSHVAVPSEIKELGQLIGELGNLRLWGRHHWMEMRYHVKSIFREVIKRSKESSLEYATVPELQAFLSGEALDTKAIAERAGGYVGYFDPEQGVPMLATGVEADAVRNIVVPDQLDTSEIIGSTANAGKVTGRVRIISFADPNYHEEVDAFREGEILVTGMTRPQIVHLCRKAAAIVTDEGGITSHAAVISRELNVPCIIATHRATNVLKTGDTVEVDATKGVVTKTPS